MHQSDFTTLNSKANRPFNVVAGSFETGEGTLNFECVKSTINRDTTNILVESIRSIYIRSALGTLQGENAGFSVDYLCSNMWK
jgi:hypothetical protein